MGQHTIDPVLGRWWIAPRRGTEDPSAGKAKAPTWYHDRVIMSRPPRAEPPPETCFLLDGQEMRSTEPPGRLVLDVLRQTLRRTGTKEGCREGDCGACTVLLGQLTGDAVRYQPVTSCLLPLGEIHGKHVVTIDGLARAGTTPIQGSIVTQGASQCGFCTPGIVVSLAAMLLEGRSELGIEEVRRALSGHLCRCTGYRSLIDAGLEIAGRAAAFDLDALVDQGWLPAFFLDAPRHLAELVRRAPPPPPPVAPATRLAGGSDLYVQRGDALPHESVEILAHREDLRGIRRQNGHLRLGALTTFEELADHPQVLQLIPAMPQILHRVASWQVRTRATLGGNLVNASPIGDMTILLLALDADIVLRRGDESRTQPLRTFYRGYKELDMGPDETLTEILIPFFDTQTRVGFEKVSKRTCLDIATVNSAVAVRLQEGLVAEARLAVGGVAPIPLRLEAAAASLRGEALSCRTIERACTLAQGEISPISDIRGSAEYKRLLVRQLLIAHFSELFPEQVDARELHEACHASS